jgi:hypothetical protein
MYLKKKAKSRSPVLRGINSPKILTQASGYKNKKKEVGSAEKDINELFAI